MYIEKCPVCNSGQRHTRFSQLCDNCGWEFKVFWGIPSGETQRQQKRELEARMIALERREEINKRVKMLEEQIRNLKSKKEELLSKIKECEEITKKYEEELEGRKEGKYQELSLELLQSEITRINEKLPLLRQLWRQKYHIEKHVILNCSIEEKTIKIAGDRIIENIPDLILGISKKPFFLIETAEVQFRIRLHGSICEPEKNLEMPLPSYNRGAYYWRVGLFNSDLGKFGYQFQLVQDNTQKIRF